MWKIQIRKGTSLNLCDNTKNRAVFSFHSMGYIGIRVLVSTAASFRDEVENKHLLNSYSPFSLEVSFTTCVFSEIWTVIATCSVPGRKMKFQDAKPRSHCRYTGT